MWYFVKKTNQQKQQQQQPKNAKEVGENIKVVILI